MNEPQTPGFLQVLGSVLAAMFGVQSRTRHERDFARGKPVHYIVTGLVLTLVFVLVLWVVVKLIMALAGV
jgi:uncharacterized membrane protein YidH (DUF202 family)